MSFPIRTNAKGFSGNSFLITMPNKPDVPVDVSMKFTIFRDVMPSSLLDGHQLFKGVCCFDVQGVGHFRSLKTVVKSFATKIII